MGLFDFDKLNGNAVTGLAMGVGAAIVAPVVVPLLSSIAKPLLKGAIKGGLLLYEKGREVTAEAGEVFEDLVVEARAEIEEGNSGEVRDGQEDEKAALEAEGRRGRSRKSRESAA